MKEIPNRVDTRVGEGQIVRIGHETPNFPIQRFRFLVLCQAIDPFKITRSDLDNVLGLPQGLNCWNLWERERASVQSFHPRLFSTRFVYRLVGLWFTEFVRHTLRFTNDLFASFGDTRSRLFFFFLLPIGTRSLCRGNRADTRRPIIVRVHCQRLFLASRTKFVSKHEMGRSMHSR